jgi:peptide-methionine (S)-S-oxide reductase
MSMSAAPAGPPIPERFRKAVEAVDSGDIDRLNALVAADPGLLRDRAEWGEGYFRRPYLLWFVAENPIRNGTLPANIAAVTRAVIDAAKRNSVPTLLEQLDYALGLVCSGRVPRECGVQRDLIDTLLAAGARPDGAVLPALAHREVAAVERLLERGAARTLPMAVCTGRPDDVARLVPAASPGDVQVALAAAALYGLPEMLERLIAAGADVHGYAPPGFHPHATPLHHAVDSGSLEVVKRLVAAGAPLDARDRTYSGTPLEWAEHLGRAEIAAYLRAKRGKAESPGAPA